MTTPKNAPETEALWRHILTEGHRNKLAVLPGGHRCTSCRIPMAGVGGALLRMRGYRQSRKNPAMCNL